MRHVFSCSQVSQTSTSVSNYSIRAFHLDLKQVLHRVWNFSDHVFFPRILLTITSDLEDEEVEQRCSKCRSAGHSTRSCPRCERCKNSSHRSADCPTIIEKEVENHFNKPMNDMTNEQLDCIFQLNDRIMKWYVSFSLSYNFLF